MRIVVLVKPVPDPGQERLTPELRLDRATSPTVMNGSDEYTLEAALKFCEAHGGEVTLLAMAPASAPETLRRGLAMGATRAVLVTDEALPGSDARTTAHVLATALRTLAFDLVLAGADTSDGAGGVVGAMIATELRLPYVSGAAALEPAADGGIRVRRVTATGFEIVEAPLPALVGGTQLLGEPRYPTLKGIMGARSKEMRLLGLADLGLGGLPVGAAASKVHQVGARAPESRGARRVLRDASPAEAAAAIVDILEERRVLA